MSKDMESAARPTFYDVQEVADMFKMSRMTVYRAISSGELAAVRIRGRWLVPARTIDALIEKATAPTAVSAGQFGGLE
ncbi:helix-turn-helix domain-containing protein [Pseudonocardia sp.]|uniref:helix-turn-helix domain-containing protein n=1 Tax=Pseudonocardia sp. TaxID=60912 RepID=UPI0025FAD43A|nr:helix-turn-helix domain-containing protein [Pseudonocardia sp.]